MFSSFLRDFLAVEGQTFLLVKKQDDNCYKTIEWWIHGDILILYRIFLQELLCFNRKKAILDHFLIDICSVLYLPGLNQTFHWWLFCERCWRLGDTSPLNSYYLMIIKRRFHGWQRIYRKGCFLQYLLVRYTFSFKNTCY